MTSERGIIMYNKLIEAMAMIDLNDIEDTQYVLARLKTQFNESPDGLACRKLYEAVEIMFEESPE